MRHEPALLSNSQAWCVVPPLQSGVTIQSSLPSVNVQVILTEIEYKRMAKITENYQKPISLEKEISEPKNVGVMKTTHQTHFFLRRSVNTEEMDSCYSQLLYVCRVRSELV